jgi:hypothetical protein
LLACITLYTKNAIIVNNKIQIENLTVVKERFVRDFKKIGLTELGRVRTRD